MKYFIYLALHAITLLLTYFKPGGIKALAAENLVLKHQLLIISRSRIRSPRLTASDRLIFGWLSMLMNPGRVLKSAIIIKPATLLEFHRALVKKKYQRLFGCPWRIRNHHLKSPTSTGVLAPDVNLIQHRY